MGEDESRENSVKVHKEGSAQILTLSGEIDYSMKEAIEQEFGYHFDPQGHDDWVVDLAETTFLDSEGISAILYICHQVRESRGKVAIVSIEGSNSHRSLKLAGLDRGYVSISPDQRGAIAFLHCQHEQ